MYLHLLGETPRIRELHLGGGTPTFFSPENLKELLYGIFRDAYICEDAEFSFEAHPNNTTRKHLEVLYEMGFRRLSLGIQDFDPKVQHIVNRIQSFEQVKNVVDNAREIGYTSINFDLIYGLPLQQLHSVEETIRLVNILRPDRIAFYSYAHVPWIKPGQRKFTEADLPSEEDKRALYECGKELFLEQGYVEIGMDHFALPEEALSVAASNGTLHRNFMGYTTSSTKLMIGLGVSAISDTWNAFGQNAKKVEEYYELINNGRLPIVKTHFISEKDQIIRKHILSIMCRFRTSFTGEEFSKDEKTAIKAKLSEMIADHLVFMDDDELIVAPHARPFVRNVCMAFDHYLKENADHAKVFSKVI
jgi:oxygen-independent coproporphyrinogen-3 oxidase